MLSADFTNLRSDLDMINRSEADWLHCDVMDGTFVPNISFGFPVIEAVKSVCKKPLDVHLMGVHQEAVVHLNRVVHQIHDAGMKAGVALNPSTPVCMLEDVIEDVDMVLLMSVNPGFGGQRFIEGTVDKLQRLRRLIDERGAHALIQIDGGVNDVTAPKLAGAGADVLVSGSYIFKSADPLATIHGLKQTANMQAER